MPQILMVIDGSLGSIQEASPRACEFYGYSKEELFDLSIYDLDTRDPAAVRNELDTALEGTTIRTEAVHKTRGGETKQVEMVLGPLESKVGTKIDRAYAYIRPKPQEYELTEHRMKNILDSLPDRIFEIDQSMKITWANKQTKANTPRAVGQFCYSVYRNRDRPCPNCPAHRALKTGNIEKGNIYFAKSKQSGREAYLANIGVPIKDRENNTIGVLEITRDMTDEYTAKHKLERSNEELRNLSTHLQRVQEEERKKIARDIHDDFGQAMTAIKMYAYWIHKNLSSQKGQLGKKTGEMLELVDATAKSIQQTVAELRTGYHDELDFRSALEWEIENFAETTGIQVDYSLGDIETLPKKESSLVLYRVLQESLTNISRHADADQVEIEIQTDRNQIRLVIRDNGIGIPDKKLYSSTSYGIIGMRERCTSAGGELHISGNKDWGTEVRAELPL